MARSSLGLLAFLVIAGGTVFLPARRCSAQFIFNNVDPGRIVTPSIDPKALRRQPIQTESKATKPWTPMPHFHNRNAVSQLPDRIQMAPITQQEIHRDRMQQNKITFSPMVRTNITPQHVRMDPLQRDIEPGQRMTAPTLPSRPTWTFNKQLQGHTKPTTRFDSSIYRPQKDLNVAPAATANTRVIPPHPMSW